MTGNRGGSGWVIVAGVALGIHASYTDGFVVANLLHNAGCCDMPGAGNAPDIVDGWELTYSENTI